MSANESVPLADAIFLELAVSKSVLGLPLRALAHVVSLLPARNLLLKGMLGAHCGELLASWGLDRVAWGNVLLRAVIQG